MSVIIRVNNVPYINFKQLNLSKSLDTMSNYCQIVVSENNTDDQSIILVNDYVSAYLDGFQCIGGYAESIDDSETIEDHDISFTLRDAVQDVIDSSVPQAVRVPSQYTEFVQVIKAVLKGLNITNIGIDNQRGSLPMPYDASGIPIVKAAEMGASAGDYLNECARIVSVIMNTSYNQDGSTNILLRNFTNLNMLKTMLIFEQDGLNNNILESALKIDYKDRYANVKIWSNGNQTFYSENPLTGLGIYYGTATDSEVRSTRSLEIFAQAPLQDAKHCQMRAREEVNIRRARSWSYTCKVQGFSANGQLWDIGQLVRIQDDKRGVRGWFLINAVEYEYTLNDGAITTLTITYPDAYGVTLTRDASNLSNPNAVSMGVTYTPIPESEKWKVSKGVSSITAGK